MPATLKLLYGYDRRNPIRTLSLCDGGTTGNIYLRQTGFFPGSGDRIVNYDDPNPRNIDGQKRNSSYDVNAQLTIGYDLNGGSRAELASLQAEVDRFFLECGLYEEKRRLAPVWLQYRWQDGLNDVREPVYGQLSQYYRILDGKIGSWPRALHTNLVANQIDEVICNLTCTPSVYGLPQLAATGTGQLQIFDDGILVADGITNLFTNPIFGHPTDFDNDWSPSDASLVIEPETRPQFTKGYGTAALLDNTDTASSRRITQSLTLTADDYVLSCYAKKLDGSAVTSDDFQVYIQGSAQTTSFVSVGDNWYLCYGSATAAAAASTHGLLVKAGKTFPVTGLQLEIASGNIYDTNNKPSPLCSGNLIGCSWSGTAHDSSSSRPDPVYEWVAENELTGTFTISFWIKTLWDNDWPAANCRLFTYYVDANNYIIVYFTAAGDFFRVQHVLDSTSSVDNGSAQTISYGDLFHLCLVQEDGTLTLYVNGASDASVSVVAGFPADGTVALGVTNASTLPSNVIIDGFKIWDDPLSATEVASLYANEYQVKNNGKTISPTPVLWDKDGDGGIDAVDGVVSAAAKDDWNVLVGVPGTAPALTEIHFDPPTATPPYVYWIGRIETEWAFKPYDTLFLDFSGTAASGTSSGDAYETDTTTGSGSDTHDFDAALDEMHALRGHFQVLGRFKVTDADIDTQPWYKFGLSTAVLWDTVNVVTNANFLLRDFGDITIEWPRPDKPPQTMTAGLLCTETEATATTVQLDFLVLLPFPYVYIEVEDSTPTFASGDTIVLTTDRTARVMDNSDSDSQLNHCYVEGEPITVIPHKYNTLMWLLGAKGAQYDVTDSLTNVKVYVTPRWTLPGQAVG